MRNPAFARPVEAEARLRHKNQLTLPEAIAGALHAEPGDTLVFETDPAQPGVAHIHAVPRALADSLRGMYGTSEAVLDFVREERAAWSE